MNDFGLLSQDRSARAYCAHNATRTVLLPTGSRHHARLECAGCRAFLKFLPRPENIERRKLVGEQIARLAVNPRLTGWERQFVGSLARQAGKLSPRQQEVLERICAAYLQPSA